MNEKREVSAVLNEALKQGAVPEGYKRVDIDFFQFKKVGDSLAGVLISKDKVTMQKGNKAGKYIIKTIEGNRISFLGSVQLDEKMGTVPQGADIMVVFTETKDLGEGLNPMKCYEVFVKEYRK